MENAAPARANVPSANQKPTVRILKRPAEEGDSEPAPKRSRIQSWFQAPSRVLSALSNGCGTLLDNIRATSSETKPAQSPFHVFFSDPRNMGKKIGVVAFHHPGQDEACDVLCGAGFLSSCADLGIHKLRLQTPSNNSAVFFSNAEAAYQALRLWTYAAEFSPMSGIEAQQLRKQLSGKEDQTFAGYGDRWMAMFAAQRAKFATPDMKAALLKTEEAFLLAHNGVGGDDTNCLGLQLMLLRDEATGKSAWTKYISAHIDLRTGKPKSTAGMQEWRTTVQAASAQLVDVLTVRQIIPPRASTLAGGNAQVLDSCLNASVLISQPAETSESVESSRVSSEHMHKEADKVCAELLAKCAAVATASSEQAPVVHLNLAVPATGSTRHVCGVEVAQSCSTAQPTLAKRAAVATASSEQAPVVHLNLKVPATDSMRHMQCLPDVPSRKRVQFADEVESWVPSLDFSDLLRVQPDKEIRFAKSSTSTTVMLKNASRGNVAFKFKASTNKCLARPMTGTIQPGQQQEVLLSLAPALGQAAVNEKYLIQAMPVPSPAVLSRDGWAARGKGPVREVRMPALRDAA